MVFASVMATLGIQILLESARELISEVNKFVYQLIQKRTPIIFPYRTIYELLQVQPDRDPDKVKWMVGIMAAVTVVKFCLTIYCRRFANEIIRAYAQDHFFDVITNSIGLATALLAIKFYWWLDPLGAILVSCPHTVFIYVSTHQTYFNTNNIYICICILCIDSIVHYQ